MAPKLTRDAELIRTARTVVQLQRKIAKYRRQIKAAQVLLRHERKMLRGLAYAGDNRPDVAPLRAHGGTTGIVMPKRPPCAACGHRPCLESCGACQYSTQSILDE